MHYTTDAQKGNMADTSGRTQLQGHLSSMLIFQPSTLSRGKFGFEFLFWFCFFSQFSSSSAVRSVRLKRPRCPGTAAARRLDGLCSLQGCLRCLLKRLCFVKLDPSSVSPESACLQVVRSFTQRHKNTTLSQVLAKTQAWETLWGLSEVWQASNRPRPGEEATHDPCACLPACHSGPWASFHPCWSDSSSDSACTFERLNAPQ